MYTNFNRSKKPSIGTICLVVPCPKVIKLISERPVEKDGYQFSEIYKEVKPLKADPSVKWQDLEVHSMLSRGIAVDSLPLSFYMPSRQLVANEIGNASSVIDSAIENFKTSLNESAQTLSENS